LSRLGKYPTLFAAVFSRLREDILSCRLPPGTVVRDIELAEQYGVSTSPIREALAQMVVERLVDILPNKAKRISPIDRKSVADFLEVHLILAQASFWRGAPKVGPGHLRSMIAARKRVVSTYEKGELWPHLDAVRSFLDPVHRASGNIELRRQIALNATWLQRLVTILGPRFYENTLLHTELIVENFRQGDTSAAIRSHLGMIEDFNRRVLDLDLPED
jgi:DNA-binding GntR family transcriptional regulator